MAAQTADPAQTSVGRCIDAIRQLILTGGLLPGETIRQGRLAELLGTSRIPVREALTTLQAEGVVTCTPRIGHAVARFDPAQFAQIYRMHRQLETELLSSVDLGRVDVSLLAARNDQLEQLHRGRPRRSPPGGGCGTPRVLAELDRHRGGAEAAVLRRLGPFTPGGRSCHSRPA